MDADQAYARAFMVVWRIENGGDQIAAVDDPGDPGGYTRGGVALTRHPELTRADLDAMTLDDFRALYCATYWTPHACDRLPWPVSLIVFDGAVNQGVQGAQALQGALGVPRDGAIGPVTLAALDDADAMDIAAATLRNRALAYSGLAQFGRYGHGWLDRLFTVALEAGAP